ncbi:S8 family peptidase, partial [Desulfococcaceae bacterium HSG8]|nr:S8 family peptidase [Desulfococcaceae bacterium HSG8]
LPVPLDRNGELLIDIKNNNQIKQIKDALAKYNPKMEKAFPHLRHHEYSELDDYYLLDIDDKYGDELAIIIKIIYGTDADWVERNEIIKLEPEKGKNSASAFLSECVNDPLLSDQWAFGKIQLCELYKLSLKIRHKKLAKIAILDTGVDSQHEDIKKNYVSTDKNYDNDLQGHGTHCAGIAGAVTDNKQGIASFFPKNSRFARITGIKVLNDSGNGTQKSIIEGMVRALDEGADVLSLSLGGPSDDEKQKAYEEVIKYADKSGAVIVVAAGNSGDNAKHHLPAGVKGVIAVSAVDNNLDKAPFSNHVNELDMGIAAPGVNIHSTIPSNKYESYSGTSMATPHVAGLVGLMKSVRPELTTEQVFKILNTSGIETNDTEETGMFIQPYKALSAVSKRR